MALNFPSAEIKMHKNTPNHLSPHSDRSLKKEMYFPMFSQCSADHIQTSITYWWIRYLIVWPPDRAGTDSSTACISYPAQVCLGHCAVWAWGQAGLHLPALSRPAPLPPCCFELLSITHRAPHERGMSTHSEDEGKANTLKKITAFKIFCW